MKKILIVDDSKEIRDLVKATLGTENYRVLEAHNGEQAVRLAAEHLPDLIIIDIIMPGSIDGIEATRVIKSDPKTKGCHVIILTGQGQNRYKKVGTDAGAIGFFSKPFSPLRLIEKVEKILAK
jgi:two-component system phosphate regulon response regulator PhoB